MGTFNLTFLKADLDGTGNYVGRVSTIQFYSMQAEKAIRMRSLVKMGFSLTDIKNIFESTVDEILLELDLDVTNTIDHIYTNLTLIRMLMSRSRQYYTLSLVMSPIVSWKKAFLATVAHKLYHLGKYLLR